MAAARLPGLSGGGFSSFQTDLAKLPRRLGHDRAIAPTIEDAVLGPPQIGNAHGQPDAEADQHHGEQPAAMFIRMRWR